ncbi:hypothetical protein NMY22_g18837 [Coprinellus aureogranulatus]|nr:hypothetical protein NMY22_g18837 [Coprinellus aureogranulatus]
MPRTSCSSTIVNAGKYVYNGSIKDPLESLVGNIAVGAMHNSDELCDAPKCHPETRVAVQQEILSWINNGDHDDLPKQVLWLSGPAGTGKTAIAGSLAEQCKEEGSLAATFFFSSFSGSLERTMKQRLISTIAYQLLQHERLKDVGVHILASIQKNPVVFKLCLADQLDELILAPLREAVARGADTTHWPKVIIIDGLDEVQPDHQEGLPLSEFQRLKDQTHTEILATLVHASRSPAFPFRILIVSRPETAILQFFVSKNAKRLVREVFLDEKYDPDADIELFLRSKFADIRRTYGIPSTWPHNDAIQRLVTNASGQFVYAATVIRYVLDTTNPPQTQLDRVLELKPLATDEPNPLATLHALYTRILNSSPNPVLAEKWIRIIHFGSSGLPAAFWRQFLESAPGEAGYILSNLTSLMSIPPADDHTAPYGFYHKTLMDFLERSPPTQTSVSPVAWWGEGSVMELVGLRLSCVLKSRGLPTPSSDLDQEDFLRNLFSSVILMAFVPMVSRMQIRSSSLPGHRSEKNVKGVNVMWTYLPNSSEVLTSDVNWWIDTILSRYNRLMVSSVIAGFFWEAHVQVSL